MEHNDINLTRFFEIFGTIPHYKIIFDGEYGFRIWNRFDSGSGQWSDSNYYIRYEHIKSIWLTQKDLNAVIIFDNGAYLFIERFRDRITVGL